MSTPYLPPLAAVAGREKWAFLGRAGIGALVLLISLTLAPEAGSGEMPPTPPRIWLNHLKLLPGDASVQVSHEAHGDLYGGVAGLVVTSSTAGHQGAAGGDKVVWMAVKTLPGGWYITAVTVCYQVYNTTAAPTSIDLIKITQVQDPPVQVAVVLEDAADRTDPGPVCAKVLARPRINTKPGPLYLGLRVNFASPDDVIVIRGLKLGLDMYIGGW